MILILLPGSNNWLSCIPVSWKPQWLLAKKDFRDAFNLRFCLLPTDSPTICYSDNCNEPFSIMHIDVCTNGGIITRRHDYIKHILAHYAGKGFGSSRVVVEPHLGELNKEEIEIIKGNKTKKARADISILDFNGFQKSSFFDICVVSPTCDSRKSCNI